MTRTTSRTLEKGFWGMSLPLMAEFAIGLSVVIIDMIFIAQISDSAGGAVGAVLPVFAMFTMVFMMLGSAGSSVASQFMGAKRYDHAEQAILCYSLMAIGYGFVTFVVFQLFGKDIGGWLGLEGVAEQHAANYLLIVGSAAGVNGVRPIVHSILNAYGRSEWNFISASIVLVINTIGNWAVIMGPLAHLELGLTGVAYVSVFSWLISSIFVLYVLFGVVKFRVDLASALSTLKSKVAPVLRIAIPSTMEPVCYQAYLLMLNVIILAGAGEVGMITRSYTHTIFMLMAITTMGIGMATQMLTSQLMGQKSYDSADEHLKQGVRVATCLGLIVSVLMLVFNQFLLNLFTEDSEVLVYGFNVFLIFVLMKPFMVMNVVVGFSLRGSGDATFITALAIATNWIFTVPMAYFLGVYLGYGIIGVMVAMLLDEAIRGVSALIRWNQRHWQGRAMTADSVA